MPIIALLPATTMFDASTGLLSFFSSESPSFFFIENFTSGNFGITLREENTTRSFIPVAAFL